MECTQHQAKVAATVTLYENFLEEKCESDLLIPDYYPAADKIIRCSAESVITKKEVEDDRLDLQGNCRICVIYQGEDGSIKSLFENVAFQESLPMKERGEAPWVQTVLRTVGTTCRLLNPRKISVCANLSMAIKVKDQRYAETIEAVNCKEAEALFQPVSVYTVLEHPMDSTKVQAEIELHNPIGDLLKTEGSVCVKNIRMLPGKAIVKGVLNLFVLYTAEASPGRIETASTAVPFSQVLELRQSEERGEMDATVYIQAIRADVESDENGKNRLISASVTLLTEGEVYENQPHSLLIDAYSNRYPLESEKAVIHSEELCERAENIETLHHRIPMDTEGIEVIRVLGAPIVHKISGKDKVLSMEGSLDVSLIFREGEQHRSTDKSLNFILETRLQHLDGRMRCEVRPCVLGMSWSVGAEGIDLKTDLFYSLATFSKKSREVIGTLRVDAEHPLEEENKNTLVVYYAEKGERLWDIARRYATSVALIKAANDLASDVLEEKKILLIASH